MTDVRRNWSISEVEATVEDYFDMLRLELTKQDLEKAAHWRTLMKRLDNRSRGAIERKHQNISAILIEMGIPFIEGYKPLSNYQRSMPDVVCEYLRKNPALQDLFRVDSDDAPEMPSVDDWLSAMEKPPSQEEKEQSIGLKEPAINNPAGVNYLEREARNQALGAAGEEFIINYERARLIQAGRESLADRIEHVSETRGPSAGYDILSYETDGRDRFIEAKTTKYGKYTPFYITMNELTFSEKNSSQYYLYRLFGFRTKPRMFALHGRLHGQCNLEPSVFIARTL